MLAEGVCTASCMRCRERNLAVLHAQLSLTHWPRRALSHTTKHCARSAIDDNSPPGLKARRHANRAGVLVPSDDITLVTGASRWRATQAKKIDVAKYGNVHNHHRWRQSTTVGDRALFSTLDRHNFPLTAATRMVDPPLKSYGTALDAWRRGCFATSGFHGKKASKATCSARNSRKAWSASGRATYIDWYGGWDWRVMGRYQQEKRGIECKSVRFSVLQNLQNHLPSHYFTYQNYRSRPYLRRWSPTTSYSTDTKRPSVHGPCNN